MTKKNKALIALMCMALCSGFSASAAYIKNADLNLNDNNLTVSGMNLEANNGGYATLLVLKPGATLETMTNYDVEKQEQTKIENGVFSIKFLLSDSAEGEYTAYITVGDKTRESKFTYQSEIGLLYEEMMGLAADEFAQKLSKNADRLNLNDTVYSALTDRISAGKLLYNAIKSGEVTVTDAETLKKAAVKFSVIAALNEGKSEQVFDECDFIEDEVLGVDTLDARLNVNAYSLYCESITESGKKNVIAGICSKDFKTAAEFEKTFVFEVTKAAVRNNINSGTGHIAGILDKNNGVNGFDLTNYKSVSGNAINNKLISGTYDTKPEMQAILNTKVISQNNGGGSLGGNGGSSGGGGSSSGGVANPGKTYTGGSYAPVEKTEGNTEDNTQDFVFEDVTESFSWAKDAIEELYKKGIINGRSDTQFAPDDNITRAEFLKIVLGIMNIPVEDAGDIIFEDANSSDWYAPYVNTAYNKGIVKGISDTYFGANENITRQDAAVLIARAIQSQGMSIEKITESIVFEDSTDVSEYASGAIDLLTSADVLHGADGNFYPNNNCTRAEAVVMCSNVLDKING